MEAVFSGANGAASKSSVSTRWASWRNNSVKCFKWEKKAFSFKGTNKSVCDVFGIVIIQGHSRAKAAQRRLGVEWRGERRRRHVERSVQRPTPQAYRASASQRQAEASANDAQTARERTEAQETVERRSN